MNDIRLIIGKNIQELRQNKKMTQFELAQKLNYTDKAISKWERGESTPEPEVLLKLSELFNVTVDYFYHEEHKEEYFIKEGPNKIRDLLIILLVCIAILTISTIVFTAACLQKTSNASKFWISFVYAVPVCAIVVYRFFRKNRIRLGKIISSSVVIWSILAVIYLQLLILGMNYWMIFLIGAPIEAALIIYNFVNK